ncbi:PREDICTED: uncharacterized protein LOC104805665 [Tarenaya hassleriana]|uniref:uncharacterized protein LOC104805665 n=1 Tax=Tarenaya hassleriana TaxID=28532 RepID=UPI00053C6D92|nr:PREDICTED: uncharacterized protein LOC104805665 [Tarenaya hassleriana]
MGSEVMEKKEATMSKGKDLVDVVFSWSLPDVLNKRLFKGQVGEIPSTFPSCMAYFKSFVPALIEETHEDLMSSMRALHHAPAFEIREIRHNKGFKGPNNLLYDLYLQGMSDVKTDGDRKQLEPRDLIAVTLKKPNRVDDLRIFNEPFLLALVCNMDPDNPTVLTVLASKPILSDNIGIDKRKKETLYGVYLINMMTNIRIWKALHPGKEGGNLNLISRVLEGSGDDGAACLPCLLEENDIFDPRHFHGLIRSHKLNSSQKEAILHCLEARKCYHTNTIKLIWGPPGTGKTSTTSVLLLTLLKTRCRTLTCAPTNIAVLEVASRVVKLVSGSSEMGGYGLGDIVLFGNGKRMKIDDRDDLIDVFLSHRVEQLYYCLMPVTGWRASVDSMIRLLTDPKGLYLEYLKNEKRSKNEVNKEIDSATKHRGNGNKEKQKWVEKIEKQIVCNALEEKRKKERKGDRVKETTKHNGNDHKEKQKRVGKIQKQVASNGLEEKQDHVKETEEVLCEEEPSMSFEEFVEQRFSYLRNILQRHFSSLCLHLPTTLLSPQVAGKMFQTINLLRDTVVGTEEGSHTIKVCLKMLRSIHCSFTLPDLLDTNDIKKLCLGNACLLFCTASGSAKLYTEEPVQLLVIDEAAQLKECESAIALQLPRLRHAILIGDECQLPAMIQSKLASEAKLGRSLFQRLVLLGRKKHLLSTQYRMHPSISIFPNREFYNTKILDASTVKLRKHEKKFLPGKMYGPFSFINVSYGREKIGEGHSLKNDVEVAVLSEIVANLFRVSKNQRRQISVGVISPYKAQVFAIQEKIGGMYSSDDTGGLFTLNIRSVDGFQGGEEDIIIISTVRSNGKGTVGFLSDRQRTNVALTRARFCLWILGNEATLTNSKSVWTKLIEDAKERHCFHDAKDDKSLVQAMARATIDLNQFQKLQNKKLFLFNSSKWKVCFSEELPKSLKTVMDCEIYSKIMKLLERISQGRFQCQSERDSLVSSFEILKQDEIDDVLSLVWAVDFIKEGLHYVQILKVWEVLPQSKVPRAVQRLDKYYSRYTKVEILRCTSRLTRGNLVLPMRWPVAETGSLHGNGSGDLLLSDVTRSFASLNLKGETIVPKPSKRHWKLKKKKKGTNTKSLSNLKAPRK